MLDVEKVLFDKIVQGIEFGEKSITGMLSNGNAKSEIKIRWSCLSRTLQNLLV